MRYIFLRDIHRWYVGLMKFKENIKKWDVEAHLNINRHDWLTVEKPYQEREVFAVLENICRPPHQKAK